MSRSYKKQGWIVDQTSKRFGKRLANRRVRRTPDVPSGRSYRKFYESYDVCDYVFPARPKGSEPSAYKDWIK